MPIGKLRNTPTTPPPDVPFHERDLAEKIRQLEEDRQRHARAIAEIDGILARIQQALTVVHDRVPAGGAPSPAPSTRLPPPPEAASPASGDRPRRRYQKLPQTGEESVLAFVRDHGKPTTAEINDHWKSEGRPGVANPTVARLLKRGLLQRENDPSIRGSRYRVA